jgi:hypothetical protein
MLQKAFIHVPGIGLVRERRLWAAGIRTWSDYLAGGAELPGNASGMERTREHLDQSLPAYRDAAWAFFDKRLPSETFDGICLPNLLF